jgi:hypothetical protein
VRILLDGNVPHPLMRFLAGHEVATVQSCGWRGVLNGELLRFAEESFDVFLLADKNMRYQQNMDGGKIAIVELPTNRWPLLLPLVASVAEAVSNAQPGEYIVIELAG